MAEINNTQWLEEYLKMWTPKERMGRIHKVTTFDPTYHCYPEGVYLLDDDCRAHTAIYVVDKQHNVHIIYDGMAWDLLARAVEKGLLEISLKLSDGDKGLLGILERMLKAQNTCCAGLQEKLKKIGDELERIADAIEGGGTTPKPKPDPEPDPEPEPKPEKKTLFLADPDRHEVTEDKTVYTSVVTSIVKDVPEQPWTITDDFATYPDWATVSTDKSHVYITTDGSKPGKGKNDPWDTGGDDHTGDYDPCSDGSHLWNLPDLDGDNTLILSGKSDAAELTGETRLRCYLSTTDERGNESQVDSPEDLRDIKLKCNDGGSAEVTLEGDKIRVVWHKGDPLYFRVGIGTSLNCGLFGGFFVKVVLNDNNQ